MAEPAGSSPALHQGPGRLGEPAAVQQPAARSSGRPVRGAPPRLPGVPLRTQGQRQTWVFGHRLPSQAGKAGTYCTVRWASAAHPTQRPAAARS